MNRLRAWFEESWTVARLMGPFWRHYYRCEASVIRGRRSTLGAVDSSGGNLSGISRGGCDEALDGTADGRDSADTGAKELLGTPTEERSADLGGTPWVVALSMTPLKKRSRCVLQPEMTKSPLQTAHGPAG
jgi:hypothetical protein